ncbi:hypothetical protein SteCoe_8199 [Stentor coeruleus]|uniref:Enoyl reductase (ER) domain-containing protein n=1 Tax=Stentor coeruleus TaxID=5963 RepID=A0A1R2CKV0_9CILI|nr:hypothetical protein SteCoe_8199 [Stentor coeruleus]
MATFSALRINKKGSIEELHIEQFPIPEPQADQVLVKVEFSTINPSDYLSILGRYPSINPPLTPGFEGSGIVVSSGGGEFADSLLNKRVTFRGQGTWAEYCLIPALNATPLLETISLEQGASLHVNPLTVALFIEKINANSSRAFVQNAAASSLGKQFVKWTQRLGIKSINLVRRQEQVDILKNLGAEHVFNTSEEGWKNKAKDLATELGAKVGFDAIGSIETNDLFEIINNDGVVYNYGLLSGKPCEINPGLLMFQGKRLEGLWLSAWFKEVNYEKRLEACMKVQENIDILASEYNQTVGLDGVKDALASYMTSSTNNKVLIKTQLS